MQEFCVGGNTNFSVCVGGNANFSVFRYQHVGIANANFCVVALVLHRRWNIGLNLMD